MFTTTISRNAIDAVTYGKIAASDGIVYLLTPCCQATATGTTHGVACRACYTPIDDRFGMAWLAQDFIDEYPAWCVGNGLTSDDPTLFPRLARIIAADLGI